ncbi:MAG: hypothetical protein EAZ36_03090 [Verrucomicrobia bacterium]|nr:MAG: hypothetical protein EAZ36_03090 [Verrucomicrobiota bacterium]
MSLSLHLSSYSAALLAKLRPALAEARSRAQSGSQGIPRPVPVLIPSAQLGDWLQIRLARDLGLSMGFVFLTPAEYLSRYLGDAATGHDPALAAFAAGHAFWQPDRLRWQLLPLVGSVAGELGHDLAEPLTPRDRFAFADLLARQFDRYVRHRPDWPWRWARGDSVWPASAPHLTDAARSDELWQRTLWRTLAALPDAPPHPAEAIATLAASPFGYRPERADGEPLFVVGTDLIDPLLLWTLQLLAARGRRVSLHLLLPSLGYLGDQTRRAALEARLAGASPEEGMALGGHPLLTSLGQQAVGSFLLLETLSPDYAEWPDTEPEPCAASAGLTLLQRLQSDVRAQRAPLDPSFSPPALSAVAADDFSLRIHSCHSPRRELEVLRDELLRAFAGRPGLVPEDVLIAVTDFDAYAPLAEAILRGGNPPLPVRLTAIPAREANPIAVGLLALLRLAPGRHPASELVELLNLTAVQRRLELVGESALLVRLAELVRASGLTHDLDVSARGQGDDTGTWRAALDRPLAGLWLGDAPSARDGKACFVHPLAPDLHTDDDARLRFIGWLTQLAGQLRLWRDPAPAGAWATRLETAVDTLLHSPELDDHAAALRRLIGELAQVSADTPLDAGTLLDWLEPKLDNATSLRTSMGGEMLFGRLDQLHGLPCRVFALLGLQDGAFPRASRRAGWDLLAYRPERWDTEPRLQDRQWFLDCLLTPTDRLILTAANRSLRTAHDGPLASCVEELLRVASATVQPPEGVASLTEHLLVRHRIQPFATDYFSASAVPLRAATAPGLLPRSFDAGTAAIASRLAPASVAPLQPFFRSAAPAASAALSGAEPLTLTLAQLASFWKDPARAWLRALQLDVAEEERDDHALDDAPLTLDGLQAYGVRESALGGHFAANADLAALGARLSADRALAPGALGALAWQSSEQVIRPLAATIAALRPKCAQIPINLDLGHGVRLTGEVELGEADSEAPWVLVHRPGSYEKQPRHQLEGFLHALVATLWLGRPVGGRVCGLDQTQARVLTAISLDGARCHLDALVVGFSEGQHAPLCYGASTSMAMVPFLERRDAESEAAALARARSIWEEEPSRFGPGGEGASLWAKLAWRDADPFAPPLDGEWRRWAEAVAAPLQAWWHGQ